MLSHLTDGLEETKTDHPSKLDIISQRAIAQLQPEQNERNAQRGAKGLGICENRRAKKWTEKSADKSSSANCCS